MIQPAKLFKVFLNILFLSFTIQLGCTLANTLNNETKCPLPLDSSDVHFLYKSNTFSVFNSVMDFFFNLLKEQTIEVDKYMVMDLSNWVLKISITFVLARAFRNKIIVKMGAM